MKKIFLLLIILVSVAFSAIDECKTDIYFGNGILTKQRTAIDNSELLRKSILKKFGLAYYNKHIGRVDYAYNRTDGQIIDLLESLLQKIDGTGIADALKKSIQVPILLAGLMTQKAHDADLKLQVEKYKDSIKEGHKVLLVAHSQGNLFAYEAYNKLPKWMQNYWEAVSVASPMSGDIKKGTPRINWNNDLVAYLSFKDIGFIDNPVRKIGWNALRPEIGLGYREKRPDDSYCFKSQVGGKSPKGDWESSEDYLSYRSMAGLLGGLDDKVHAFTFYMGKPLAEENYFDNTKMVSNDARVQIMSAISAKLNNGKQCPCSKGTKEPIETQNGAIEVTLSWTCGNNIDMNLLLSGPNVQVDVADGDSDYMEHAYVATQAEIKPGDKFVAKGTGEKKPESDLDDSALEDNPINLYAVVKTPGGSKFKQYEAQTFEQLNLGEFAEIEVKNKIYAVDYSGYTNPYRPTPVKQPPYVRTYNECDDEDKKHTCGCVPCEYIIHGMDGAVEYGPIGGADVEIIRADTYGSANPVVVYRGKTTNESDIFKSGLVKFTQSDYTKFEDDVYYVVDAKGGSDLDRDDNLVKDDTPTPNNGTIHAIISGADLKTVAFRVNALTEAIYQTSGDLLGNGYDSGKLDEKLAYASKKLFREKTFIFNNELEINYHDALLWAPGVDKKKLFKPYDTFVEPIVVKTYADQARVKESYRLIYEKLDTDAPQLTPLALEIPDTIPNGSIIGKVKIESGGVSGIDHIELHGDANSSFSIDKEGLVKVVDNSEFIIDGIYKLDMTAVGADAKRSIAMELVIKVIEGVPLADPNATVPTLDSVVLKDIRENSVGGTVVGQANFVDNALNIVNYKLSGEDNNSFSIDNTGEITVANDADIDYEKSDTYTVKVSAINEAGNESFPVELSFKIINEIDTPLHDLVYLTHLSENIPIGTIVGKIVQLREGRSPITSFDILNPNVPFALDVNGTIRTTGYINYEDVNEYDLLAMAKTDSGNGNKVEIQILVDDIYPETGKPTIKPLTASIDENTNAGIEVGQLEINKGASAVELVELRGTGHSNFTVDVNGTIRVANAANLDYEQKSTYALQAIAHNANGSSTLVPVSINLNNLDDEAPTLLTLTKNIEENATANTVVGTLRISSNGEGNVTGYTLTGTGSENFNIDENGTIRVSSSATLDYETTPSYTLQATVLSDAGESDATQVRIFILNVAEHVPVLKQFVATIEENATTGTIVGQVQEDVGGDSPIVSYALDDNSTFNIDENGTIRVNATLDYETQTQYLLQVSARNSAGWGSPINIQIEIIDVPDVVAVLEDFNGTVNENSIEGSEVGQIVIIDHGDTPVSTMVLTGGGSQNFTVDNNGILRVSTHASLDYEKVNFYNLKVTAVNLAGDSKPVAISIKINNVLEFVKLLDFKGSLEENTTLGTIIGSIKENTINGEVDKPIERFTLYGTDVFGIDDKGLLYLIKKVDFEKNKSYDFTVTASNITGESNTSSVHLDVSNVMEWLSVAMEDSNQTTVMYAIEESISDVKKIEKEQMIFLLKNDGRVDFVSTAKFFHPRYLSYYDGSDEFDEIDVVYDQKKIYTINETGFLAIDISDILKPTVFGEYTSDRFSFDQQTKFSHNAAFAYRGCFSDGLEIIDTNGMQLTGLYESYGYIEDIAIDQNNTYAYLATLNEGLEIIDLQDVFNPFRIGQYIDDNYESFSQIKLFEDTQKIYLKNYTKWDIVDISDPTEPQHIVYIEENTTYGGRNESPFGVMVLESLETINAGRGSAGSLRLILRSNIDVNLNIDVITLPQSIIDIDTYKTEIALRADENKTITIPYTVMENYDKPVGITIKFSNEKLVLKKRIYVKIE